MCTITYLPLENGDYILTQNRDVGTKRVIAIPPERHEINGQILVYPVDPQGGGTWNAVSETHHAFIMNGAEFDYYPAAEAVLSRGELCIGLLLHGEALFDKLEMQKFDHFTIVLINTADRNAPIREWRWNGRELNTREYPGNKAYLWISHGLYSEEDYMRKTPAFQEWYSEITKVLQSTDNIAEKVWEWHHLKEVDGKEGFIIDRDYGVMTVSVLQTKKERGTFSYRYEDIKTEEEHIYENLEF